jgi:hypothetical protein
MGIARQEHQFAGALGNVSGYAGQGFVLAGDH